MFKSSPGLENLDLMGYVNSETYAKIDENSGFQSRESHSEDWPSLYQRAFDNLKEDPSEETLERVCSELVNNCPQKYEPILNPTVQMLQDYVKNAKQKCLDDMTGLYNQGMFYQTLENVISKAERHGYQVSVLAIDCDHFKGINDNYGHQEGDRAIQYMADIISSNVRKEDVVARYGGDEFAVILDNTDTDGAYRIAERIQEDLENNPFKPADGNQVYFPDNFANISLSYGIATSSPGLRKTSKELYNFADTACYEAKKSPEKIVSAKE